MTLLEYLVTRNIPFHRHSSKPNEIWVCCPICQDGKFRLGINLSRNLAHCFNGGCAFRSRKATSAFAYHFGIAELGQDHISNEPQHIEKVRWPEDFTRLYEAGDRLLKQARSYALARGVDRAVARQWRVGASFTGRYAYRVVFPVIAKKLIGIVARDFTGCQEPKYLMNSGPKHIWGARKTAEIVLAEGVFKALALERSLNLPGGALLGHTVTPEMLDELEHYGVRRVFLWPDPDRAGVTGIVKLYEAFHARGFACYLPSKLPQKPADESPGEQISKDAVFVPGYGALARYRLEVNQR